MKKYQYIVILVFFPSIIFGQKHEDFNKLIKKINHCLLEYTKLIPHDGREYHPISDFELSEQEIKTLGILNTSKDSIEKYYLIGYFQGEIKMLLDKIIKHPDFFKNDIIKLIEGDVLTIVKSDDNKLLNISFDEKTGGTYRSQISRMYYINKETAEVIDLNYTDNSIFASDGYNAIYSLLTIEGTKYVLTGYVRGCSYCFQTFVQLIKFEKNEFVEEFVLSLSIRGWNDGVIYVHEEKTIYVDYHIDDLTPSCYCSEEEFNYNKFDENQKEINCKCKYIFDGKNFELVETHWKIIDSKNTE
jgi:hypothetical protein